ncbi:NAD(P)/FAD-dependent oxidoreductase [Patescibacteria group bacterium]|nr:NAD(P)/FAD-dependent oxidoreductase [Patescibacteria group bacterium]MBU1703109.1 NAD(P)/FAD-dependent oxidoreductase [Patescibacteria group bacterium]MBU1953744.1 NAD(P)/FAD-dependent oxidoreductase [Patescibacteria group bacterium]
MKRVAIIGGGAAGMMAASAAAVGEPGCEVTLFEKNAYLGAKVIISGGGRCNVTSGIFDVDRLLENYPRGAKFLMSAMFRFPPDKVIEWFEDHGVRMKIEEDLRAFPVSNNGKDVVCALEKDLRAKGIRILFGADVKSVRKENGVFLIEAKAADCGVSDGDVKKYEADFVVITTGGNAYRHTGSTGDGYAFAKSLGHTITKLAPSLSSLIVFDKWLASVAGVSFAKAGLTLASFDGKRFFERTGAMVITHGGVSGPAVFAVSAMAAYESFGKEKPMVLTINFFPDETAEDLEKRFQKLGAGHGKKRLVNLLDLLLPKSFCDVFVGILKFNPDLQAAGISKEQRKKIVDMLQHFKIQIVGRGAGSEFVTAGGVDLSEVHSHSMESKLCPGLFFAGEILDIDGFTGGFNLQASWACGKLAGDSIAKRMNE